MRTQIGRWGNSLAVRIPSAFAKDLDLKEGMDLDVSLVEGALMLRPRPKEYTLDELLAGITPENVHGETDWPPRRGVFPTRPPTRDDPALDEPRPQEAHLCSARERTNG